MTFADAINLLALPVGILTMVAIGWSAAHAAAYLREKTHNERLARLADGVGRIAGDVAGKLEGMPPGSGVAAVKAAAVAAGVSDVKSRFADTIKNLGGASDATLAGMITGELGKLGVLAPVKAAQVPVVAAAA